MTQLDRLEALAEKSQRAPGHIEVSEDFRQEVKREWRWQLFDEAVAACDKACDKFWRHLDEVRLRPPCRNCGKWPCECRD